MMHLRAALSFCFLMTLSHFAYGGILDSLFGSEQQEPVLSIGTNVWPGYEPLYLARALNKVDAKKINLVEYSSATQVIKAFRGKSIQVAALTLDEVLLLKELGMEPRVILIMDISDGADVIVAKPEFSSIKALKGKRIGVEASALGAYVLSRALQEHGMVQSDVKIVSLEVDEIERAYSEDQIDAAVTFEPVRHRLLKQGAVQVFDSSEIPGEIVDVLVTTKQSLETNPNNLQHVIDGWFETLGFMQANQNDAATILSKRLKISPKEVIDSYDGLKLPDRSENVSLMSGKSSKSMANAQKLMQTMLSNGILKKEVDLVDLFEPGLVAQ